MVDEARSPFGLPLALLPTCRRARSEHASAIKAMQARHAKGLLSQAEQVRLAEEMALMKDKKENRDCVVV